MSQERKESLATSSMAKIGDFIFKATEVSFSKLSSNKKYVWKKQAIVGGKTILLGGNEAPEKVTIQGDIYKSFHNLRKAKPIEHLEEMAQKKKAYDLTFTNSFRTKKQGKFVIEAIKQNFSIFNAQGIPVKTTFTLELLRYDQ